MDRKEIYLLKSDLAERYKTIDRIYKIILERQNTFKNTVEGVEGIAYHLHSLYGSYEQLFEVVAPETQKSRPFPFRNAIAWVTSAA